MGWPATGPTAQHRDEFSVYPSTGFFLLYPAAIFHKTSGNCGISVWLGKISQYCQLLWDQLDTQTQKKQDPIWSSWINFPSVFTKHSPCFPLQISIQFYNIVFLLLLARGVWEGRQGKLGMTNKPKETANPHLSFQLFHVTKKNGHLLLIQLVFFNSCFSN